MNGLALGWVFLLAAMIAGCGFHLRGEYELPSQMSVTYLEGDRRSGVVAGLRRALRGSDVRIAEQIEESTAVLKISGLGTERRVLSVGSGGKVNEYELSSSVTFEVYEYLEAESPGEGLAEPKKGFAIEPQTLRVTRSYLFDETGVLGATEEEEILSKEMERDLVDLIMFRLQARGEPD